MQLHLNLDPQFRESVFYFYNVKDPNTRRPETMHFKTYTVLKFSKNLNLVILRGF